MFVSDKLMGTIDYIKMDSITSPQKVKPNHLDRLSIGHKPHLLHVSGWDKYMLNMFFPKMFLSFFSHCVRVSDNFRNTNMNLNYSFNAMKTG